MTNLAAAESAASQRRTVHFDSIDDALIDVTSLAAAEREGKLRAVGQWTFGQILGHVAAWVDYGFTGVPVKVPFFLPWILKPLKKRILNNTLPAGRNIPRVAGGTLAKDVIFSDEGVARFGAAFTRLKTECPTGPHILFGRMSHEDWIKINLRHAELHLSFLRTD